MTEEMQKVQHTTGLIFTALEEAKVGNGIALQAVLAALHNMVLSMVSGGEPRKYYLSKTEPESIAELSAKDRGCTTELSVLIRVTPDDTETETETVH